MNIGFYNLDPARVIDIGNDVSIKEVIDIANSDSFFKDNFGKISKKNLSELNVVPQKNPLRWEKVMTGMIYSLTRKIPYRDEVKTGRQLFEGLDKNVRKNLSINDVFGLFPYLISGFKINLRGNNGNDTNSLDYLVSFTENCFSGNEVNILSYLCAHKESREKGRDLLRPSVEINYANRAINLMKGIIRNSKSGKGTIQLYQSKGNPEGMNALFPQIFLKYHRSGRLNELRDRLNFHYSQMEELCNQNSERDLEIKLNDARETYKMAEDFCVEKFGLPWRELLPKCNYGVFQKPIFEAHSALKRLLQSEKIRKGIDEEYDETLLRAVELFRQNQEAHLIGKAALENMFYYTWGKNSASVHGVAIGLDVDHDNYQIQCFSSGYNESNPGITPILYARRRGDGDLFSQTGLNNLSIRQFWR